ncbi:MAG: hypothetical protein ACRCSG_01455 [Cellulosilyticaceae bacterium]
MSTFQRIMSNAIYEFKRKKKGRNNNTKARTYQSPKIPKVVAFKVGGQNKHPNSNKNTTMNNSSNNMNRFEQFEDYQIKKIVGMILIALGCILLLSKCFF